MNLGDTPVEPHDAGRSKDSFQENHESAPDSWLEDLRIIDVDSWPHRKKVELTRHVFTTRIPIPLPDGFQFAGPADAPGTGKSEDRSNWVQFQVHHVESGASTDLRAAEAVFKVAEKSARRLTQGENADSVQREYWTVVDSVTPTETRSGQASDDRVLTRNWEEDSLLRIVHVLREVVRAERAHSRSRQGIPSYEQILSPVLGYQEIGEYLLNSDSPEASHFFTIFPRWSNPSLVLLDHQNVGLDQVSARADVAQSDPALSSWLVDLELGLPSILWRERLADADYQFHTEGRYDLATILSTTATEILIDGLLKLLWWEKSLSDSETSAAFVAEAFNSSRDSVTRMNKYLAPMLGGTWSDPTGPVQQWLKNTWKLRHRSVHAGYFPRYQEADLALKSSYEIATFFFDRLSEKRNEFSRVCLSTVAQSGLEKRNLWNGKIRRFAETVAEREPDWRLSMKMFLDEVEKIRES
ncbi:hypothetical protein HD598_001666 [Neomicrococcus aestuarii]|uniref:Uncharacterized protein n=1 Tax=Neomicrococcus aestuarii TaxID=556325 RepID=A0A7W8TU64_9MICC|nr:hypothetical protein [Neomicrococcus aestuarii]MBB5512979.1 hypothetical protein [Neomicrococcus aestuarii]